jgi:hypothetical protein
MRSLINYLGALAAFLVLGASMAFINWIAQFEFLGWLALGFIFVVPFYLAVKFWRSL